MLTVRLAQRPLRVGFVVKHGDFDALWKAVRFNTCLWGGLFNPIIPIREGDERGDERAFDDPRTADYLVSAFDVDLLHPVSGDEASKAFIEAHSHLEWPREPSLVSDEGTEHEHLTLLDVMPILHGLPENTSRESEWAIPSPPMEGWRANLVRVMCGDPDGVELGGTTLRRAYSDWLHPTRLVIGEGIPLPMHLVTAHWPISLSTVGLERFRPRHGWSNPGVVLGDATDFDDLVAFWNLRAAGNDVMFFPTQDMTDARSLARVHLERVGKRHADPWDGPTIWHLDDRPDAAVIEQARELLGGIQAQRFGGGTWNGLNIKPVRVACGWDTAVAHLRDTHAESAWLDVQLPQLAFDKALFGRWNRLQRVALDVDANDFLVGDERLTLKVPPLPRMNAFLDSGHAGVRVKREHLSVFADAERSVFHLSPFTFRAVMREVLAHCGFRITDSVPGKYCRRILEQMGGVDGCRVLKIPGVRRLLRRNKRRGLRGDFVRRIIACHPEPEALKALSQLGIFLDGERATGVALRHLVRKGILRPGIILECEKCGEDTWYATTRLRSRVRCACCGAIAGSEARIGDGLWIRYRVDPLWIKLDVQYGAIPVILALWRLEEWRGIGGGRYLTCSDLGGPGLELEVDFLGLIEEPGQEPLLLAGECKSTHEPDEAKRKAKLEKLKMWYDAVERAGLRACIAFATVEPDFDPGLLAECEAMIRAEKRVLLMTARELDPYFADLEEGVPRRFAVSIEGLCGNSVARYLPNLWREQQEALPKTEYRRVKNGGDAHT